MQTEIIPAGTKVRVKTTNGGDAVAVLESDYVPTFAVWTHNFSVESWRVKSVEPID